MPIIDVKYASQLTDDQLASLITGLTDSYATATGAPRESVQVLVTALPADRWGVGGQSLAERRKSLTTPPTVSEGTSDAPPGSQ
jgi:4-oxalocrotonate tautomerase